MKEGFVIGPRFVHPLWSIHEDRGSPLYRTRHRVVRSFLLRSRGKTKTSSFPSIHGGVIDFQIVQLAPHPHKTYRGLRLVPAYSLK